MGCRLFKMGILKAEQIKEQTMNIKEIQELIKFVSKSGVNEVAIEQVDFKITIKTNQPVQAQLVLFIAQQALINHHLSALVMKLM